MRNAFIKEPFKLYMMDVKRVIEYLHGGGTLTRVPDSSNWKIKVFAPKEEKEPYWKKKRRQL